MESSNRKGAINASSADILDMRATTLDIISPDHTHALVNDLFLDLGKDAVRAKNGENLTQTARGMLKASERKTRQATKGARTKAVTGVRYVNGVTQPATRAELQAEATKDARHSAKLGRHLKAAGENRPSDAIKGSLATHHIVAAGDKRANRAKSLLFNWGIGINDVDNGVRLPRWLSSPKPAALTDAIVHSIVHTDVYHLTVYYRLKQVAAVHPAVDTHARVELRGMKQELEAGVFPY